MTVIIIVLSIIYLAVGFIFLSPYKTASNIFGSEYNYISGTLLLVFWLPFVIFFMILMLFQDRGGWI